MLTGPVGRRAFGRTPPANGTTVRLLHLSPPGHVRRIGFRLGLGVELAEQLPQPLAPSRTSTPQIDW